MEKIFSMVIDGTQLELKDLHGRLFLDASRTNLYEFDLYEYSNKVAFKWSSDGYYEDSAVDNKMMVQSTGIPTCIIIQYLEDGAWILL